MSISKELRELLSNKDDNDDEMTPVEIYCRGMDNHTGIRIVRWILEGELNTYYRDSEYDEKVVEYYEKYLLLKADQDLTVSRLQEHPATSLRYVIYSAHTFNDYQLDGERNYFTLSNRVCTIPRDSYFLVLDVFAMDGVTQVTLLHVPYQSIDFFMASGIPDIIINGKDFVGMARMNLQHCMKIHPDLDPKSERLEERTRQPIGFDEHNNVLPLDYTYDVDEMTRSKRQLALRRDSDNLHYINYPVDKEKIIYRLADHNKPGKSLGNINNNARADLIEQMLAYHRHLFPDDTACRSLVRKMAETHLTKIDADTALQMLNIRIEQKWMDFARNVQLVCTGHQGITVERFNAIVKSILHGESHANRQTQDAESGETDGAKRAKSGKSSKRAPRPPRMTKAEKKKQREKVEEQAKIKRMAERETRKKDIEEFLSSPLVMDFRKRSKGITSDELKKLFNEISDLYGDESIPYKHRHRISMLYDIVRREYTSTKSRLVEPSVSENQQEQHAPQDDSHECSVRETETRPYKREVLHQSQEDDWQARMIREAEDSPEVREYEEKVRRMTQNEIKAAWHDLSLEEWGICDNFSSFVDDNLDGTRSELAIIYAKRNVLSRYER